MMEDDGPIADACKMPSFISTFEEGRVKLSRNQPTETSITDGKVERSLRDLTRGVSRSDSPEGGEERKPEEEEEEEERDDEGEKDAEGNNNNNCNSGGGGGGGGEKRRASAAEVLRRNFGVSRAPSVCLSSSSRMQRGIEDGNHERNVNNGVTNHGTKCGECDREATAGEAVTKNEPTPNESTTSDAEGVEFVSVTGQCRHKCDSGSYAVSLDESFSVKEHVYCTVYCIANDSRRLDVDISDGYHETITLDPHGGDLETGQDAGSSPEKMLYTLDDLVDPFGIMAHRLSPEQASAETAMPSCRVCLESKTIAPLPCCRTAVCDECLKLYVSSQVGRRDCEQRKRGYYCKVCDIVDQQKVPPCPRNNQGCTTTHPPHQQQPV